MNSTQSFRFPYLFEIKEPTSQKSFTVSTSETVVVFTPVNPSTGYATYLEEIYKGSMPESVEKKFNSQFKTNQNVTQKHGVTVTSSEEDSTQEPNHKIGVSKYMKSEISVSEPGEYFVTFRACRPWLPTDMGFLMVAKIEAN